MKELAQLLNEMQRVGVIRNYALFGATAQVSGSVSRDAIKNLVSRYDLAEAWRRFESKFLND